MEDITALTLKTLIPKKTDTPESVLARRYRYLTQHPTGAEHLFSLLNQKKGTVEDFHTMLDRVIASAIKAGVFE